MKTIYENISKEFGILKVIDNGDIRYLELNGEVQGTWNKKTKTVLNRYMYSIAEMVERLARRIDYRKAEVLVIGAGACLLHRLLPDHAVDYIDIDARIPEVASGYFEYFGGAITINSPKDEINVSPDYDFVVLDASTGKKPIPISLSGAHPIAIIDNKHYDISKESVVFSQDRLGTYSLIKVDILPEGPGGLRNVVTCYYD